MSFDNPRPQVDHGDKKSVAERWDPEKRQFTLEKKELLSPNVGRLIVDMRHGTVRFEVCGENEHPSALTRVVTSGSSEEQAKKLAEQQAAFSIKNTDLEAVFEDELEGGFGSGVVVINGSTINTGGGVYIGGNVSVGGGIFAGRDIVVNGRRISSEDMSGSGEGTLKREVVFKIDPEKTRIYEIKNDSGEILLPKGRGEARLNTQSGTIRVEEFRGIANLETTSGNIHVKKVIGEFNGNASSGNIKADVVRGTVNAHVSSGNIVMRDLAVEGRSNRIKASSGDIQLGISNKALRLRASSSSGDIDLDENSFRTINSSRKKGGGSGMTIIQSGGSVISIGGGGGGNSIEAVCGSDSELASAPELSISVSSGDISVDHTGKSEQVDQEVTSPQNEQASQERVKCAHCQTVNLSSYGACTQCGAPLPHA